MKTSNIFIIIVMVALMLLNCGNNDDKKKKFSTTSPYSTDTLVTSEETTNNTIRIAYEESSGIKTIPVIINNSLKTQMVYDTGASDVCIALPQAVYLYQQGQLTESDFGEEKQFVTASGQIHPGLEINLREIQIGEGEESVNLTNIKATVVASQSAPLLLGQSALERFASVKQNTDDGYIEFENR